MLTLKRDDENTLATFSPTASMQGWSGHSEPWQGLGVAGLLLITSIASSTEVVRENLSSSCSLDSQNQLSGHSPASK